MAGRGTDTLHAASALYVPLQAPVRGRGVLALEMRSPARLDVPEERRLLEACASQIALALERVHFVEVAQQTQIVMEGERMRNTLLSAVSHDLRTPLTSILGAAQAALPHVPQGPGHEMLVQLRNQAQSMQQLVENLLAMARMQQGGVHLKREWIPVEELVGSALQQLRDRLAGHPVRTDLPAHLPLLSIDGTMMERVLVNLLDNACRYTPEGTILRIAARVESTVNGAEQLVLSIADSGPGLPVQMAESELFEPFTRGVSESSISGIGLGLALARRIVEAHGGTLTAHSAEPGPGAVFAIALPVQAQPDVE